MRRSSIGITGRGAATKGGVGFAVIVMVSSMVVVVKGWSFNAPEQRDSCFGSTRRHSLREEFGATSILSGKTARTQTTTPMFLSPENSEAGSVEEEPSTMAQEVSGMRLSEIKAELKERNVDFSDCFDKESMVSKLADARINNISNTNDNSGNDDGVDQDDDKEETAENTTGEFDREAALNELKSMRVRELREELGRRRISRAGLFEKEDLVNALVEARAVASVFSATGMLTPGEVAELPEAEVRKEINHPGSLLLLDVYATWCGPCQMIAPFLKEIAAEQGDQLRIVKMDSDKNPGLSSELKVQGLPTLVLFEGGNEINRIEGGPTKEQLMGWIDSHR